MSELPVLVATSVVRGSAKGQSHGGIYLVDFARRTVQQRVDWNNCEIDFSGRGWDRGMRGIAFWRDRCYVAASDLLLAYDRDFNLLGQWGNPYLRHCHEIARMEDRLFLTSTGFDAVLCFDLRRAQFSWASALARTDQGWLAAAFDPHGIDGPEPRNTLHLNNVHVDQRGIFLAGARVEALLHLGSDLQVREVCTLPAGTHNARPFRDGVLFNDTAADTLRFVSRSGAQRAFPVPGYDEREIEFAGIDDSRIARQRFARGLCVLGDTLLAGGSSPSTISLYDLARNERVAAVNLSMDIRNAIHGLEVWPFT